MKSSGRLLSLFSQLRHQLQTQEVSTATSTQQPNVQQLPVGLEKSRLWTQEGTASNRFLPCGCWRLGDWLGLCPPKEELTLSRARGCAGTSPRRAGGVSLPSRQVPAFEALQPNSSLSSPSLLVLNACLVLLLSGSRLMVVLLNF